MSTEIGSDSAFSWEKDDSADRARRPSRHPFAWLGTGALSLGVGAALVTGHGFANADTGSEDASASRSAASAPPSSGAAGPSRTHGSPSRRSGLPRLAASKPDRPAPVARSDSPQAARTAKPLPPRANPPAVMRREPHAAAAASPAPLRQDVTSAPPAAAAVAPVASLGAPVADAAVTSTPPAAALRTPPQVLRPLQNVLGALGLLPTSPTAPAGQPLRDLLWGLFRRNGSQPGMSAASAATSGNTVSYSVASDWGTGHTAALTLTAGQSALNGWTVEFDSPATITSIWNGQINSHVGTHYVITNMAYNSQIPAGGSTSFGYQATPGAIGSAPTNIKVNGIAVATTTPPPTTPPATTPTLSVADLTVAEGNTATTNANFTVSLSKAATTPVTVGYTTANGTATAGTDYTAGTGTLTFAPGTTTQTIAVKVLGDTTVEPDETFTLALSNPTGATLTRPTATATITNDDKATTPSPSANAVNYSVASDWGTGHTAALTLTAGQSALNGWTVEFDSPATITSIWNGQINSHVGTHYVITNMAYNSQIPAGGSTSFGYQATPGAIGSAPTNIKVNGIAVATTTPPPTTPPATTPTLSVADLTVAEGNTATTNANFTVSLSKAATTPVTVGYTTANGTATAGTDYTAGTGTLTFAPGTTTQTIAVKVLGDTTVEPDETFTLALSNPTGATLTRPTATATITNDDKATTPGTAPGLSISDATATEPGSGGMAAGYLHTSGNQILDSQGKPVQISGVNWFGAEGSNGVPDGLWTRNYKDMIDQMSAQGFNTIRIPYSSQMLHTSSAPSGINYAANPDLQGLSGLQVLDQIVNYAGQDGMRVILDHHRSTAGAGTSENGLWYNAQYTEDQWVSDWQMLATRYKNNPTVIGFDLHNEPYNGTWGGGGANDWARAAERAGNAVLAVNPDLLVFVEGVGSYQGDSYWWGGELKGVKDRPIVLNVANHLVYSPHDYPNSVYPQPWFQGTNFGAGLPAEFRQEWGYIYENNIAPIYLGEFGTKLTDPKDSVWFEAITSYLSGDFDNNGTIDIPAGTEDMSWTYWSWNPNSGDTGGILADDWTTINQNKMAYLTPIEFTGGSATSLASFTVSLNTPAAQTVTVQYSTSPGTATAAADYTAASGTVTFAPGESRKTISVAVKPDSITESNETFTVMLSNPSGATLTDATGVGTIIDRPAAMTGTGTGMPTSPPSGTTTSPPSGMPTSPPSGMPTSPSAGNYVDLMTFGMFNGSSHTGMDAMEGGRTAITTEALVAYNDLRRFAGLPTSSLTDVGKWAFANNLTNNAQAWGNDLQGVGLYYAMQGAKVGWIADDKYNPQIVADIERTARTGSPDAVMAMVAKYGHPGFAQYLMDNGYQTAFVDTLKMEPHYAGWMHDRANGRLLIDGAATAHDVNHLTVLSHDQMRPFMNDTWDWPQWPALQVADTKVIEYFQSMVALGNPLGKNLTVLDGAAAV